MSASQPRLTLDEMLLAAWQADALLLLVEGPTDRAFFTWFIEESGRLVHVYSTEDVELPDAALVSAGLPEGARSRILLMARDAKDPRLYLIADRDCGEHLPDPPLPRLLVTDFPALESYAFTTAAISKWLRIVLRDADTSAAEVLEQLKGPLHLLYNLRASVLALPDPPYDRAFLYRGGTIDVNRQLLRQHAGLTPEQWDALEARLTAHRPADPREWVYGHDFGALIDIRFKNAVRNRAQFRTREAVERSLCLALERVDCVEQHLFGSLMEWLTGDVCPRNVVASC